MSNDQVQQYMSVLLQWHDLPKADREYWIDMIHANRAELTKRLEQCQKAMTEITGHLQTATQALNVLERRPPTEKE
jgi:hypothetical protein